MTVAQVTVEVEITLAKSKSCPVLSGTSRCIHQDGYTHYSQNQKRSLQGC